MEKRPLGKRLRRLRNRILVWIAVHTLPYIYLAYIRFVWWTSKLIVNETVIRLEELKKPPHKLVAALWHQDVFAVAWAYRDFQPHTLASVGDAGEIITAILNRCNFTVLRGGSSKGSKRHREVLPEIIAHFGNATGVFGITVDGSYGPAYRLKRGAIVIAKECHCHVFITRIWYKRKFLLPTWDRTTIPLPFNQIAFLARGPFPVPPNADDPEVFEQFRQLVENELLKITHEACMRIDHRIPSEIADYFPAGWKP